MIYLDNAATTKPSRAACEAMLKAAEIFGNPSSLHGLGFKAEKLVTDARETIARMTGTKDVFFTSGGTEANNFALFGAAAKKHSGRRIIVSKIEHPSVLEAAKKLERDGYDVVYADVDGDGRVNIDKFADAVTKDTILVSVMHVNNETGVIQPIKEISEIAKSVNPECIVHCDCVQSFGKIPIALPKVDAISVSAHKIHGFKGCGALCTRGARFIPIIYGGEQQGGIRPGTENVGGILAFAAAAAECVPSPEKMRHLRDTMKNRLAELTDVTVNGSDEYNSGSVLNVSFAGIKAEILLHSLERYEIYVSTGSACSSHKPQPSHVLTAMGCSAADTAGAIRISFDTSVTAEEVLAAADKIAREADTIRAVMKKHR